MMVALKTTATTFGHNMGWHDIKWAKTYRVVRRLQVRIVKAVQQGDWRKAKRLQRLLTRSFSGRALAVRRVIENQGSRTPGVDGIVWRTPATKTRAVLSLTKRGYKPLPLRRVYIPKANGKKKRPLGIPTMKDRAMQALHLLALEPIAETTADPNSYGFRRNRATRDAAGQLFNCLGTKRAAKWILDADISGCFDNISQEWLLANIPLDKDILRRWLKSGFVEKQRLFPTEQGTPQGGIISPTLANMVLNGMEKILKEKFGKTKYFQDRSQVHLTRYADDFVITGRTEEYLRQAKEVITDFLKERGLTLSPEKTRITHIDEGFDFLGWNFRKYNGRLLIKPAKKNVKNHIQRVREVIKEMATAAQQDLIRRLNPIIRGWVNYHANQVSKMIFNQMDHETWKALWKWARRRHPINRSRQWIKQRYFHRAGNRDWVFGYQIKTENGVRIGNLVRRTDTPIHRYVKIKADANPFDPKWEVYFEERYMALGNKEMFGKWKALWKRQNGKCPMCQQVMTVGQELTIHHRVRKVDGGQDILDNLQLLHLNCHRQHHANEVNDEQPAVSRKDTAY